MTHHQQSSGQWSRDFLKCDQCRKEHKKCSPRTRDWDSQQQKCDRCYRLGHPCGPPMRKQKLNPTDRNGAIESIRPLRRQTPRHDAPAVNTVDSVTSQSRPVETWSSPQGSICLVSLAVIVSTHELLLSRLLFLKRRTRNSMFGSGKMEVIGETLTTTLKQLHRAFKRATRSVQARLASVRGLERELLNWKMAYFNERHYNLRNIESLPDAQAYVSEWDRRTTYISHDTAEARILSCTSRVFYDLNMESRTRLERSHLDLKDYLDLESHIKTLFLDIQDVDVDDFSSLPSTGLEGSSLQELDSFPASHIAYFNQDRVIALQLWKRSLSNRSGIDILGRSLVHVVAASHDRETIASITKHAPEAVKNARLDHFGFYPIDLVNGPDSHTILDLLRGVGGRSVSDPHRERSRPLSGDLARLAEGENCGQFGSMLRNNEHSTGTPEETYEDLDRLRFYPPGIPTWGSIDTSDPMDFSQSLTVDQSFGYGNHAMHGQRNPFQSAQSFNGQPQFGLSNTAYTMSGSQFPPSHIYSSYYSSG